MMDGDDGDEDTDELHQELSIYSNKYHCYSSVY